MHARLELVLHYSHVSAGTTHQEAAVPVVREQCDDVRFRVDRGLDATIRLLAEGAQRVVGRDGTRGGDARVRKRDAQCGRAVRGRTHATAMLGRRGVYRRR